MKNKIFTQLKEKAFTLAETLIVIGVIGVVAALTLPNLNSSTGDKERVTKVKKIFSNLTDSFERAQAVYGPYDEWFNDGSTGEAKENRFGDRLTEFMKLSKNCRYIRQDGACWTLGKTKYIGGSEWKSIGANNYYKFILADGTAMAFAINYNEILIDIDGVNKGKNTFGIDIFNLYFKDGYLVPGGMEAVGNDTAFISGCVNGGGRCMAWVIENGNMDYLKADKTTGKCNDSDIVLNWTTNIACH